jgi:hypothetical protein
MAQQKQSARQVADAALAALAAPKVDELIRADPLRRPTKGATPEGFKGDKPGFFRGARIRR